VIAYDPGMGLGQWLRGVFSTPELDDEAAVREEYNLPARGEDTYDRDRRSSFSDAGESTAESEIEDHGTPSDPAS
jgi:hypothetical protein